MILVTGGTGLLGTHLLLRLLQEGQKVRATYRKTSSFEEVKSIFTHYNSAHLFDQIEWVKADLTDIFTLETALEGIAKVYHCAAVVSFDKKDHDLLYKINVEGTANLVNMALDAGVKKLCHVSSTAAVAKSAEGKLTVESNDWKTDKNNSVYSISKFGAEREVWRGTQEGLPAVVVNPSVILGPGNWEQSSTTLFKTVWDGLSFYTAGGNGFVDVRDVVDAMFQLMESDCTGERFLVVGENASFKKVFDSIAKALGKKAPHKKAGPFLTSIAWRLLAVKRWLTGKRPAITKESAHSAHQTHLFSTQKIEGELGFKFRSLEDAVENAGAYFLSHNT